MSIIRDILLLEGRQEDVSNKYIGKAQDGPIKDRLIAAYDVFISNDPSGNHKYLGWMMKQMLSMMIERGVKYVDYHENGVMNHVISFHTNSKRLAKKDLNQYKTVSELEEALESLGATRREQRLEGADKVFENDRLLVVTPKTEKGSCYYGAGTRWCVAGRDDNMFDEYSEDGLLYYIIWKVTMPENLSQYQKVARYIYHGHPYETEGEYYNAIDDKIDEYDLEKHLFGVRNYYSNELGMNMRRVSDMMKPFYDSWEDAKIRIDTHYAKNGMSKPRTSDHDDEDYDDEDF